MQAVQTGLLSSRLPDVDLQELKQLRMANGESWIQFEVLAVARYAGTVYSLIRTPFSTSVLYSLEAPFEEQRACSLTQEDSQDDALTTDP